MSLWIIIISGIFLGLHDIVKKKALQENSLLNVLAVYSLLCFLLVTYDYQNALSVSFQGFMIILLKALILFISGLFGFSAIRSLPISIITPFGILTPVFSIFLGVFILGERIGLLQIAGILIVLVSYYFFGRVGRFEVFSLFRNKYLYMMIASTLLSAVSSLVDKVALQKTNVGQMQFWTYFILSILNFAFLFYHNHLNDNKQSFKYNYSILYIILTSVSLVLSNLLYFYALKIPSSQISIIIPLRKISIIISAIVGGIIFREKNMRSKLICVAFLMVGLIMVFLGK